MPSRVPILTARPLTLNIYLWHRSRHFLAKMQIREFIALSGAREIIAVRTTVW